MGDIFKKNEGFFNVTHVEFVVSILKPWRKGSIFLEFQLIICFFI